MYTTLQHTVMSNINDAGFQIAANLNDGIFIKKDIVTFSYCVFTASSIRIKGRLILMPC